MIDGSTPVAFITLAFGVVVFVLIMFLPAVLELKKPRDSGPRKIIDDADAASMKITSMEKAEEIQVDEALIKRVADVLAILPNLET